MILVMVTTCIVSILKMLIYAGIILIFQIMRRFLKINWIIKQSRNIILNFISLIYYKGFFIKYWTQYLSANESTIINLCQQYTFPFKWMKSKIITARHTTSNSRTYGLFLDWFFFTVQAVHCGDMVATYFRANNVFTQIKYVNKIHSLQNKSYAK